jgi:DNA-directed RNA polymerase II subunit RPB2
MDLAEDSPVIEDPSSSQKMEDISWAIIDKMFKENPFNLVAHHLDSYNDFFSNGIFRIFRENNPLKVVQVAKSKADEPMQAFFYMGGKDGNKIYFGKPIIYDKNDEIHYMYPNEARLRNMTYGFSIHYDVDVVIIYHEEGEQKEKTITLTNIYLGNFPIMVNSNLCILHGLATDVKFNLGECKNDYGGYFIIDGKEKSIVCQETRADNMLYIQKMKPNDPLEIYSHVAEIRSVSEDASKPMRTTAVKIVSPSTTLTNGQIVVEVPNVRKPVPLFILMRALGVLSDESIIKTCLLDLNVNSEMVDLFIPSIHDASKIFNQVNALQFISTFTKRQTISNTLEILMNAFLPHVGELNFLDKAYFIGYMVYRMLKVYLNKEAPTNRDNFKYKRVELTGALLYDLFREYYLIQSKQYMLVIEKSDYFNNIDISSFIQDNQDKIFKKRIVEQGVKKAFKGNWGSQANTKRIGVVQDLNRLSWFTAISQLRRINLPLSASAKVVGPHLLNNSQWGYIDPIDTPDGGNVGLHKHLAISCSITDGFSSFPLIKLLKDNVQHPLKPLQECSPEYLAASTKVFVNGNWIGVGSSPIELTNYLKLLRRNGLIPAYTSITFNYETNEIYLYTDSGRLIRPIYYVNNVTGVLSINRKGGGGGGADSGSKSLHKKIMEGDFNWSNVMTGFYEKAPGVYGRNRIIKMEDLYPGVDKEREHEFLNKHASLVDYIDVSEEENLLIANNDVTLKQNKYYTNVEIHPSLIFGVMGNSVIYPENNPLPRNQFSCGQSKQAVSVYHTNSQVRFDKMGVIMNYAQVPLVKSRYLEYINKEENPYGVNAIVAIMSYTGYNVEDAILINEGALKRGLFNTTYRTTYSSTEETSENGTSSSTFANILADPTTTGLKLGHDYSQLDEYGLIKEETEVNDKMIIIGKKTSTINKDEPSRDGSVVPKKGQLGVVDKVFITDTEEGSRLAKVRVREQRSPAIGDKMASRSGQKGTIGLIVLEEDMPFTAEGIRPDLIINPHAIPSRMTIGQLIECLLGKACSLYGFSGDCTAFATKGANYDNYGKLLTKMGFSNTGNELLCSGMTGEQLEADVYIGPTYYMRLKHMVKDKVNSRSTGPRTLMSRQPVQGRANDGGLRIGEMERDGILAHGASAFLNESYMVRGDQYYMAICNKTGMVAVYNETRNLFISPYADGPLEFSDTVNGTKNIKNISRFGRSFSIVRVPYSLKLLIQELQTMNIQMRIITDANVDQLMNMGYSNNVQKLLQEELEPKIKHTNPARFPEVVVAPAAPRQNKEVPLTLTMFKYVKKMRALLTKQNPKFKQIMADRTADENVNKQLVQNQVANEKVAVELMKQGWEERFNVQENKSFWFNNITKEQVDERPEVRIVDQEAEAQTPEMMDGPLAQGWEEFYSEEEKRPYWHNKELNTSVWVKPLQPSEPQSLTQLSQFADPELAEIYVSLGPKLKNKVDSIADQNGKEIYMRKIIEMRKSLNVLKMSEQAPPEPSAPPPQVAQTAAADQVVSAANVLEVEKEKEVGAEEQGSEVKEESGSSSPGEKKIIKIDA